MNWPLRLIYIFLIFLLFVSQSYAIEGRCVPTPPCYCNEECFRCGPGGCSKPSSPSYQQKPSYDYEAERQRQIEIERQRQEELAEQLERQETAAKKRQAEFEKNKQDALNSMKGISENELGLKGTDSGGFGLKDIGDTGKSELGLKEIENSRVVKDKQADEKRRKGWQKALGCAMQEICSRVESLGPEGVSFAQELRSEMTRVFNEAGQSVKDKEDVNIVSLKLDRQLSSGSGSKERQFIAEVAVHSKGDGQVDIDVQSYFSKTKGKKDKQEYLQSFLVLDKNGKVINGDKSKAVNACLKH